MHLSNHQALNDAILRSGRELQDVAAELGVSTQTLYAWRKGLWRPSVRMATRIHEAFPSVEVSAW